MEKYIGFAVYECPEKVHRKNAHTCTSYDSLRKGKSKRKKLLHQRH